jgi:hypothetical protein
MGAVAMEDWQQRVVEERDELAGKLDRLMAFINEDQLAPLATAERERLTRQRGLMAQYRAVLDERIAAFAP